MASGTDAAALLAALLEASEDLVVATDAAGRILAWSSVAARTLGYGAREAEGQHVELVVPAERRDSERAARRRVFAGEEVESFETARVTKDGRAVDLVLRMLPIHGQGGPCGCLEIGREKTKAAPSDALGRAQSLLPLITENVSVLISYVDRELRYRLNNSAYESWFGLRRDEVEGQLVRDVLGPAAWTKVGPRLQEAMAGQTVSFEEEVDYARAGKRWIHAVYAPHLSADGSVLGVAVLVDDITAQKRVEQSLAEADRRKDEFLAMLAHELRNPLAPLKTALQIVCETSDGHARERACGIMNRQLAHLARLVEDLLDVSRVTHGAIALQKERLELEEIVQGALETSGPLLEQRRHVVSVELPPSPILLHADRVRLIQVFSNLLNNAAQYTEPGGAISLKAEIRAADRVEVTITDTGIGMEPQFACRVFELFARSGRSLARTPGLGVGLFIVRRLIELHGGSVSAHSEGPGRGSAFTVNLPLPAEGRAASAEETDLAPGSDARARRRVLLIEDNRDARESLSILLRFRGHHIRFANDGAAGLDVGARFQPDAVLLDINLPGMDGYAVAREIRRRSWGAHLLLVATTGWGQGHDIERAREAGFDFHLTKPLDLDFLDLLLQEGSRARRPPFGSK